jgi:hypothetical protein
MANARTLRFSILKQDLAVMAGALRLRAARPTHQFDVANRSVIAEMAGDREIINSADGS